VRAARENYGLLRMAVDSHGSGVGGSFLDTAG